MGAQRPPGNRWRRALRDHTQEGSLPCSRSLSKHPAGKASGLEPETRPLSTGPPGSGPARSGLDAHGAPPDRPGPSAGERKACLSGTLPALLGFGPPPTPIHQEAEQQPAADLPTPVLGAAGGSQRLVFPACLRAERAAPRQRENTPPSKTRLFLRRQKGWAANSLSPLTTLGQRHEARQVCASFRPLRAQPHLPPGPNGRLASVLGLGAGQAEGLAD